MFHKSENITCFLIVFVLFFSSTRVLQNIAKKLPDPFKVAFDEPLIKRFEYEFHSAGYHLMMEVVTALRTIIGHLVKELGEGRKDETALKFMLHLCDHLTEDNDVLYEIGVQHASPSQLRCLGDLPLRATYSCLQLFFNWVDEGFYDFSTLPFTFKRHLMKQDQLAIEQLPSQWSSTDPELIDELQNLMDVLKKSEQDITSQVNEVNVGVVTTYAHSDMTLIYV